MAFPTIQFKAVNTNLEGSLQDLVEHKFNSLEKYLGDETDVKCEVEFEKEATKQHGKIYCVKVNLTKAGERFHTEYCDDSFEKAIDEVRDELDKALRRTQKKKETLFKSGARVVKDLMRFGN